MRAVIVDDEEDLHVTLSYFIKKYLPQVSVVGNAISVKEGLELIQQAAPDLVFLDFEMADGTGFDLLDALEESIHVIFITAHSEHALRAFRYSAVDYLLKPVDPLELVEAVNKIEKFKLPTQIATLALKKNLESDKPKHLVLKDLNNIFLVELEELLYCKSENYYTTFYLNSGKSYVISKPLKHFEEQLKDYFLRVHQSYLVNFKYVLKYEKQDGGMLILKEGTQIPVSVRKKEAVLNYISNLGIG